MGLGCGLGCDVQYRDRNRRVQRHNLSCIEMVKFRGQEWDLEISACQQLKMWILGCAKVNLRVRGGFLLGREVVIEGSRVYKLLGQP